jgi:hypothetical protein
MNDHPAQPHRVPALAELRDALHARAKTEAEVPSKKWTRPLAATLAGLAVGAVLIAVVVGSNDDGTTQSAADDRGGAPDQVLDMGNAGGSGRSDETIEIYSPTYASLAGLTDASQVVVEGTVQEVRSGREVVDIDPEYPTRFLNTVVQVDDVLKGTLSTKSVTVETMDLAFGPAAGRPASEWRKPGERVVAFLSPRAPGDPVFGPTTYAQSFYRVTGAKLEQLSGDAGPLGERIAGMSLPELERAVPGSG